MPWPVTSGVTSTSVSPRVNRTMTSRRGAGGSPTPKSRGLAAGEPVDDLAAGGGRQRAVEDADPPGPVRVQRRGDRVDRLAGERDDEALLADAVRAHRCPQHVQARESLVVDDGDLLRVG